MSADSAITAQIGVDSILISPLVSYLGQSSTGYSGEWSWTGPNGFTSSERSISFYPFDSMDIGQYIVQYTSFGCTVRDTFELIPAVISSQKDVAESIIQIYPNPSRQRLTIESNDELIQHFQIVDMLGHSVMERRNLFKDTFTISVADLPSGLYFIRIDTDNTSFTKTFRKRD